MLYPSRDTGVHRLRPWPTGPLRGNFAVAEGVIASTETTLLTFRGAEASHEGIAFWAGVEMDDRTIILSAIIPTSSHGPQHVRCTEADVREAARAARQLGLGLLAQVHSHGGDDARHSDGDDQLILMPFEGMLSIVVPHHGGRGMKPLSGCGIHQFQDKRWVLCTSGLTALRIMPAFVDIR